MLSAFLLHPLTGKGYANNDVFEGLTSRLEVASDLARGGLSMVSPGLSFDSVERPRPA
jgi:hypothetical protein